MRRLQRERQALDREQADVAARVEALRGQWARASAEHADAERERCRRWSELETEAAAAAAKLEAVEATRGRMVDPQRGGAGSRPATDPVRGRG